MALSSDDILKCRLRFRDEHNVAWYDVCNTHTFVRDVYNEKWIPVYPGASYVQAPDYVRDWLLITCDFDQEFDNPCDDETLDPLPCTGQPNDERAGSGNGSGSFGAPYNKTSGYPVGYDLPDAGVAGFRLLRDKGSPSGYMIYRPVLGVPHTYNMGIANGSGRGTWSNPLVEYDTLSTGNVKITETIIGLDNMTGVIPIYFSNSGNCCVAIDVYLDGKRIATTCGSACLSGVLHVTIPPHISNRMLVRFTKDIDELDCNTDVRIGPEKPPGEYVDIVIQPGDAELGGGSVGIGTGGDGSGEGGYGNLDPDGDGELNGIPDSDGDGIPDGLPDIGTPMFPVPCSATIRPDWTTLVNNVVTYSHYVGKWSGRGTLCFDALSGDMKIELLYEGRILATSSTGISSGCIEYTYMHNLSEQLVVRITTSDATPNGWEYSLYCIRAGEEGEYDDDGSWRSPYGCGMTFYSTGAPLHKHFYNMGYLSLPDEYDRAIQVISCNPAGNESIVFSVYDQANQLLGSYRGVEQGMIQIPRSKEEHGTLRDVLWVYVEAPLGADWSYFVNCPVPLITIEVEGEIVPWTPSAAKPS